MAQKCMKASSPLPKNRWEPPALRIAELENSNDVLDIKSHPKASTKVRLCATRGRTLHEHALPELTSLIDPASIFRLNDLPVPGTRIRLELQGWIRRKDETLHLCFRGCRPVTRQLGAECSAALLVLLHGANEVLHHDVAKVSMSIAGWFREGYRVSSVRSRIRLLRSRLRARTDFNRFFCPGFR